MTAPLRRCPCGHVYGRSRFRSRVRAFAMNRSAVFRAVVGS